MIFMVKPVKPPCLLGKHQAKTPKILHDEVSGISSSPRFTQVPQEVFMRQMLLALANWVSNLEQGMLGYTLWVANWKLETHGFS